MTEPKQAETAKQIARKALDDFDGRGRPATPLLYNLHDALTHIAALDEDEPADATEAESTMQALERLMVWNKIKYAVRQPLELLGREVAALQKRLDRLEKPS